MNRRTHGDQLGPSDRIAAFAQATELYAESLEDPDLANVYWGKSLGLWQAVTILSAEDSTATRLVAEDLNTTAAGYLTRGWEDLLIPPADPPSPSGPAGGRGPRRPRAAANQPRRGRRT
jgi:hypothetical protein